MASETRVLTGTEAVPFLMLANQNLSMLAAKLPPERVEPIQVKLPESQRQKISLG
jgi:hypothetical protein